MGPEDGESTDEYRSGSAGYSASGEAGAPEAPSESAETVPFWKRGGYESFRAYLDHQNRLKAEYEPLSKGTRVPVAEMPGQEVGDVDPPPALAPRLRQVNVKLRSAQGEDLDRAARIYGLAPSTLARAIVNRGVRAILEANGFRSG
jgi:hypothetical protein